MIPALKIDANANDVHEIWIPVDPAAMKLSVRGHLNAARLAIGGVMMSGDILLIDPDKSRCIPHFLFLGAGAPIPGSGVMIGPANKRIVAPTTYSADDILERTVFMDAPDAHEWLLMWANEIDIGAFTSFVSLTATALPSRQRRSA